MDSDRRVCTIHVVPSHRDTFAISTPDAPSPFDFFPYVIVGMGKPGINCGTIHQGNQCRNCYQHYPGISQCNQKQCPTCYNNWINKTFSTIYARLTDPKNVWQNRFKHLNHIPLSVDPGIATQFMKEELTEQQIRKLVINLLKNISPMIITKPTRFESDEIRWLEKYGFVVVPNTHQKTMSISKEQWDRLEKKEGKKSLRWRKKMGYSKPLIITVIRRKYHVFYQQPDGVMIFHPYRFNERGIREYLLYIKRINPDSELTQQDLEQENITHPEIMKIWEWLRAAHPQTYKKYLKFSPHFHFIGWTGYLPELKKGTQVIYKKKDKLGYYTTEYITQERKKQEHLLILHDNREEKGYRNKNGKIVIKKLDLIRSIRYPLTHTVDRTDKKYYTNHVWLGKLSTRNGKTDKEEQLENYQQIIKINEENTEEKHICKNCGGTLGHTKPVVEHFFQKYEKKTNIGWYTYPDLIAMVQKNKHITEEQRRNMTETLTTLQNCNIRLGKPPP